MRDASAASPQGLTVAALVVLVLVCIEAGACRLLDLYLPVLHAPMFFAYPRHFVPYRLVCLPRQLVL